MAPTRRSSTARLAKRRTSQRAISLIEGLVVITIGALLLALTVPSFVDYIRVQRLKAVAAQLVTDLQYARSEAAARNQWVRIMPQTGDSGSCYTIFVSRQDNQRCNCRLGASAACNGVAPGAGAAELKTVVLPPQDRIQLSTFVNDGANGTIGMAYDHVTGSLASPPTDGRELPMSTYGFNVSLDATRVIRVTVNRVGRVSTCIPVGSKIGGDPC
ncbi:MAG: GspH/FimT family pseudopilin [Rubrivivax sp.]|jgi:type IV fimbrial biogenesis protein FimT